MTDGDHPTSPDLVEASTPAQRSAPPPQHESETPPSTSQAPERRSDAASDAGESDAHPQGSVGTASASPDHGQPGVTGGPWSRHPFAVGVTFGFGLLLVYLSYLAVSSIWSILVLVIVAGFFAIGLNPAVARLQSVGLPRGLAISIVVLAAALVGCGGLTAVVPPVVNETRDFIAAVPGYVEELQRSRWLQEANDQFDILGRLQDALTADNVNAAAQRLLGFATVIFGQIFNILTVIILTLYFLVAFERLKEGAYRLIPASRRDRARQLGDAILEKVGGYMVGALLIALLAGLSSLVFMLIVDIPYPFALAVVIAICDLIPQVGATLGAAIVSLVALTVSVPVAVATLVFFVLYQQLENWVIYPRVMRRTTQISDLAAILGVLIGASLLGVVGVLIAIPATAAIQLIVREVVLPRQDTR